AAQCRPRGHVGEEPGDPAIARRCQQAFRAGCRRRSPGHAGRRSTGRTRFAGCRGDLGARWWHRPRPADVPLEARPVTATEANDPDGTTYTGGTWMKRGGWLVPVPRPGFVPPPEPR